MDPCITGDWQIIVQTETINQKVAVDMCHAPDLPCPGMADCGKKSRCVQRYSYQVISEHCKAIILTKPLSVKMLLSLPTSTPSREDSSQPSGAVQCPSIRAFRFPSGCVCHAEIVSGEESHDHGHS